MIDMRSQTQETPIGHSEAEGGACFCGTGGWTGCLLVSLIRVIVQLGRSITGIENKQQRQLIKGGVSDEQIQEAEVGMELCSSSWSSFSVSDQMNVFFVLDSPVSSVHGVGGECDSLN